MEGFFFWIFWGPTKTTQKKQQPKINRQMLVAKIDGCVCVCFRLFFPRVFGKECFFGVFFCSVIYAVLCCLFVLLANFKWVNLKKIVQGDDFFHTCINRFFATFRNLGKSSNWKLDGEETPSRVPMLFL